MYNILLRILLIGATYGFIYKKLFVDNDFPHLMRILEDLLRKPNVQPLLWTVAGMMILNWGIESLKWRYLIRKIENISFLKAFGAILTGSSISFFTPNRVGEFFGRIFILDKASHVEGILITILGSLSQLLITILTGTIALLVIHPQVIPKIPGHPDLLYYSITAIIIILDLLFLIIYFNISLLAGLKKKLAGTRFRRFAKFFRVFECYSQKNLLYVVTLSFIRYLVFSLQYWILLRVFSLPVPLYDGLIIISIVFLIITVFPTIAFTELGIRDSVALYFFGIYFTQTGTMSDEYTVGVLSATTFLWLLNLAVPALAGTIFVYRLKFFRKRTPEAINQ